MIPSEYGSTAPTSAKSLRSEVRHDDPPLLVQHSAVERACEQLHLRELHRLVDALEDPLQVGARLEQVGREPQRLRSGVRVLEAPGVGHEPRVERLRDRGREGDTELGEHVGEQLRGRRRLGGNEVRGPEAGVVVVVVDVDHHGAWSRRSSVSRVSCAQSTATSTLSSRSAGASRRSPWPGRSRNAYSPGQRRLSGEHHDAVLAELDERQVHREQRAERVPVRVLVRGDEKAVARTPGPRRRCSCQSPVSSLVSSGPGSRSSISLVIRTPCSTD